MIPEQIIKLILEQGMGAVAIGAGIWLLWYMIKHTVIRLGSVIDKIVIHLDEFRKDVSREHDDSTENQKEILAQHREITEILRGINNRIK